MIENENPGVETLPYTSRTSCWSFPASGEIIHHDKTIHKTIESWFAIGKSIGPRHWWFKSPLILLCHRDADTVLRMFWSQVKQEGRVPMNKLLVEMLEANTQWLLFQQRASYFSLVISWRTTIWVIISKTTICVIIWWGLEILWWSPVSPSFCSPPWSVTSGHH